MKSTDLREVLRTYSRRTPPYVVGVDPSSWGETLVIIRSGGRASRSWQQASVRAWAIGMHKSRAIAAIAPGLDIIWGLLDRWVSLRGVPSYV